MLQLGLLLVLNWGTMPPQLVNATVAPNRISRVLLQQSTRRQSTLAFSLLGVLLAHGDLRNNKLSQLAVNLWNLCHKHGYCETRLSVSSHTRIREAHLEMRHVCTAVVHTFLLQVRTLEYIKHQAQQRDMTHLTDVVQRLMLQSRT